MRRSRSILAMIVAITGLISIWGAASTAQAPGAAPAAATAQASDAGQPLARELTAQDLDIWLDGFMRYALPDGDIAGAAVVVVKDGEVLAERGFGYADVKTRRPVDPVQTVFRPGSVSKLVTWTAVMQQVEHGRIDLDADINTYLDFEIPDRAGKPITMRQIMTHTAGFEEQLKQLIVHRAQDTPPYDELLKRWVPQRIFEAGTTPAYSNYATSLAGYIVERVSGEPFVDYVQRHIFVPLAMTDSTFQQPLPAQMKRRMSVGYTRASGEVVDYEFAGPIPAGSMASTPHDMARFMLAHLNGGELDGKRILKAETARQMHTQATTIIPGLDRMLLGFFETNINGRSVIGHLGDTKAFHSSMHLFLDEDTGLYITLNSTGKEGASNRIRIALFEQFADRYFPGDGRPPRQGVSDEVAAEHARMMAGNWVSSRRAASNFVNLTELLGQLTLSVGRNGNLEVPTGAMLTGRPADWVEIAPFVWQDRNSHSKLAAVIENGEVTRFSMSFLSAFTVFERPLWYKNSALLMPLIYAALVVFAFTAVLWPVRALVRRRFGAQFALTGRDRLAYRLSRLAALLLLLLLVGWMVVFSAILDSLGVGSEGMILLMQVLTCVVLIGQALVFAWYAWCMWTGRKGWAARIWSVALLLSGFVMLWLAVAFHLLGFGADF
jgi:CubicO group peptidase (beta-lactamase class C family)